MKKFLTTVAAILTLAAVSNAQEVVNKKGEAILPKAGDFGLSIDAVPMLNYFGSFLSETGANATGAFYSVGIKGHYFLQDDRSIIATLNFGINSSSNKVLKDSDTKTKNSDWDFSIEGAYAFHRGYGRFQATYGPSAIIELGRASKVKSTTEDPDFELISTAGMGFGIGVGGFVGAEYFIAPKFSVGGSVGLDLMYNTTGKGKTKVTGSDDVETAGNSSFELTTGSKAGLFLTIYF